MKNKLIFLALISSALVLGLGPAIAFAADSAAPAAASPWYLDGGLWTALLAVITGLIAIWQKAEKTKTQKIVSSLVLAIEEASKVPAIVTAADKLKSKIRDKATAAGVEDDLNTVVQRLTQ